ncbi:response regulator [Agaribacterium sp. ZY112]|uniref:response regulator n=1 Tax=Agaribacterium sp. ZY112 TaxID=3233574 RepID=UPI00352465CE
MNRTSTNTNVVLAVDDSPEALGLISRILEPAEMTTLVALDGNQALSIAEKMQPDIILLDALMPTIDGFQTCLNIKAIPALQNTPIIFMTGLSDTDSIVRGFDVGGTDFLTKPIKPQELIARIKTHLTLARAAKDAQSALDHAGQNVLALDAQRGVSWSTPEAGKIINQLDQAALLSKLLDSLQTWLKRSPDKGNKNHFKSSEHSYVAVYIGLSRSGDHLIRLVDENDLDERTVLLKNFPITPREADVFMWLARGKANRDIALILDMSPRTVNKHLEQLFRKLNVENRTAAAGLAMNCLQKIQLL